jgi:glyoxylase-like metal-dependent hydrolase (beta-lactamase superfamily II)
LDELKIGHFPAFDYFADGSFYLLDTPGHAVGHLCGLARTTLEPPTFVLLGGDICHYAAIFRPSKHLPVPKSITPHPFTNAVEISFCPGGTFENLQRSRGRKLDESIYDITFGHDIPLAMQTRDHLQELDCDDNVFVIIAHDATVRDAVDHFPKSINDWKERGWARDTKWAFFKDFQHHWELQRQRT